MRSARNPCSAHKPCHPSIAAFAGVVLMLIVAGVSGQDYNWDLLNYHFASPELLLSGRSEVHVAPSGLQSWFNPIGYIPAYLMIEHLPPWLASALLAAAVGLNAPLIYLIADRVGAGLGGAGLGGAGLGGVARVRSNYACVAIGMSGAVVFSEAGTSFLDCTLSIAVLGAVLAAIDAVRAIERTRAMRLFAVSGALLGMACGLKLTIAVFAVGMAVAVGLLVLFRYLSPLTIVMLAMGGAIGFALTGGWWAWRMWDMFGNPVFPMFNDMFASPAAPAVATVDTTYLPQGWAGIVTYPWHWLIGDTMPGSEIALRDRRYPVALVVSLIVAVMAVRKIRVRQQAAALLVALFCLASYLVWLFAFSILRYLAPIEMLAGVALLAGLRMLPAKMAQHIGVVMIGAALLLSLTTRHEVWGRARFGGDWFGVGGIDAIHRPNTVYVLPGDTPLGFMIHLFPDDARFMRIGGTFPLSIDDGLGAKAAAMIDAAPRLVSLSAIPMPPHEIAALRRFGLRRANGRCGVIKTKTADVETCELQRVAPVSTTVTPAASHAMRSGAATMSVTR